MHRVDESEYLSVLPLLESVQFATLSFTPVLRGTMRGTVFRGHECVLVCNDYGMSLLVGVPNKTVAQFVCSRLRRRMDWLQYWPVVEWRDAFAESAAIDMRCQRVNFAFCKEKFMETKSALSPTLTLREITVEDLQRPDAFVGTVLPMRFWNGVDAWTTGRGKGFCIVDEQQDRIVCWAFSSATTETQLELGIETLEAYRGKGLAQIVCRALILFCLEKNLQPVWCCRRSNLGSVKLAESLGFEEKEFDFGTIDYVSFHVQKVAEKDYRE